MSVFRAGTNKSSVNNFPSIRPTLDLDFANSKTLDPRIDFTRASGGSYVGADGLIKYAGVNEPRFDHDPVTGESLGLLIEESRGNFLKYSEDFTNGVWTNDATNIISTSGITSPSGSSNGNIITNNSFTFNFNYTNQAYTTSTKGVYTYSLFVKDNNISKISFLLGTDNYSANYYRVVYTFSTQSFSSPQYVGLTGYVSSLTSTSYPNGWYKVSITFDTSSFATQTSINIGFYSGVYGSTAESYGKSYYIWGAQLEQGSFPTSYIPTQGSTRTRQPDSAQITGKNFSDWYNQSEGTIVSNYSSYRPTGGNQTDFAIISSEPIPLDRIVGWQNINQVPLFSVIQNNTLNFLVGKNETYINRLVKKAIALKTNDMIISVDGVLYSSDLAPSVPDTLPTTFNRMLLGIEGIFSGYLNGHIKQFIYYPKRLPNAQLQALTR